MAVVYRPHRGSLGDAMAKIREFDTVDSMLDYISQEEEVEKNKIEYELYGSFDTKDIRVGWPNCYIVSVSGYGVLGFFTDQTTKKESLKAYKKWWKAVVKETKAYNKSIKKVSQ